MREKIRRSAVPLYGVCAVWIIYCLFFPLYKLWHFIVLICLAALTYVGLSKLFPGKVEKIPEPEPEPEKPETTGDEKIDAMLKDGRMAVSEMHRLGASIKNESVKQKTAKLADLTDRIFKDVLEDPADYTQIRRFADYFLPTTLKLLNSYDRMSAVGTSGENITGTLERIEDVLDTTINAYEKQLDALFFNQALDIETDITVLESMLKKEGLFGKDF